MQKHYHSSRRRAGSVALWGLLAILVALALLFWPSKRRRIEGQILAMANAISHEGASVSQDWLRGLGAAVRANCSRTTTAVTIEDVVNEPFTQDQIIEAVATLAASSTRLSVKLEHISVDLSGQPERASANADVTIEIEHDNRVDRERRHVFFSLRQDDGTLRIVSVEATGAIVNPPEPRP
jgi:hypothetical protein